MNAVTTVLQTSEQTIEEFMAALEGALLSIVGRVGVWVAPLPSAILVSRAAGDIFDLSGLWPWVMAGVIEIVGLVTSSQWLTAREWNRTRTQKDAPANEALALALMVSYFVTTALMLLAFEIPNVLATGDYTGLTALLFPALSAVGIVTLNERVVHHGRVVAQQNRRGKVSNKRAKSAQKSAQNDGPKLNTSAQKPIAQHAQNSDLDVVNRSRKGRKAQLMEEVLSIYLDDPQAGVTDVARSLNIARNSVYNYLGELEEAGRIKRNGTGIQVLEV